MKWIDGKDIYSKTVYCGTLPNNSNLQVNHGISNFGHLVSFSGVAYTSSGACMVIPSPINRDSTNDWAILLYGVSSSMIDIRTKADWPSFGAYHVYVTLYYVKTT